MAFQKGPGEGYGTWGREEVLKRFPEAVCKRTYFAGNTANLPATFAYRVYEKPDGYPVGTAWSAREAWCQAATNLADIERQKAEANENA